MLYNWSIINMYKVNKNIDLFTLMSDFCCSSASASASASASNELLLKTYDKYMTLKIYVHDNLELKELYSNAAILHNTKLLTSEHIDAGFDIFSPRSETDLCVNKYKLDFEIKCSSVMNVSNCRKFNTGYYMYPRSSLSKTNFRLANCVGIIDSGYRGNLIGVFDVLEKIRL
jgi:hypothetical protein